MLPVSLCLRVGNFQENSGKDNLLPENHNSL